MVLFKRMKSFNVSLDHIKKYSKHVLVTHGLHQGKHYFLYPRLLYFFYPFQYEIAIY